MAVKKNTTSRSTTAAKKEKKSTKAVKHAGDILGLSGSRPPKPKKPLKSASTGKRRRPKGIEVGRRGGRRPHLPPARVRG
jgi:hypothetical protein